MIHQNDLGLSVNARHDLQPGQSNTIVLTKDRSQTPSQTKAIILIDGVIAASATVDAEVSVDAVTTLSIYVSATSTATVHFEGDEPMTATHSWWDVEC